MALVVAIILHNFTDCAALRKKRKEKGRNGRICKGINYLQIVEVFLGVWNGIGRWWDLLLRPDGLKLLAAACTHRDLNKTKWKKKKKKWFYYIKNNGGCWYAQQRGWYARALFQAATIAPSPSQLVGNNKNDNKGHNLNSTLPDGSSAGQRCCCWPWTRSTDCWWCWLNWPKRRNRAWRSYCSLPNATAVAAVAHVADAQVGLLAVQSPPSIRPTDDGGGRGGCGGWSSSVAADLPQQFRLLPPLLIDWPLLWIRSGMDFLIPSTIVSSRRKKERNIKKTTTMMMMVKLIIE